MKEKLTEKLLEKISTGILQISIVDLSNQHITTAMACKLAAALIKGNCTFAVNLNFNDIEDEGAIALAKTNITALFLKKNKIKNAGAQALALNKTITKLDLSFNFIESIGIEPYIHSTTLLSLVLNNNSYTCLVWEEKISERLELNQRAHTHCIKLASFILYARTSSNIPPTKTLRENSISKTVRQITFFAQENEEENEKSIDWDAFIETKYAQTEKIKETPNEKTSTHALSSAKRKLPF